jgi:Spy/CpxP family protein refolding chaperone
LIPVFVAAQPDLLASVKLEIKARLHLSPEQENRLAANRTESRTRRKEIQQRILAKRGELKSALEAAKIDATQIQNLHGELKGLMNILMDEHLAGILKTREILTPDQHLTLIHLFQEKLPPPPPPASDTDDDLFGGPGF